MQKDKLISLVVVIVWLGAMFLLSRAKGQNAEAFNPLAWLVLPLMPLALIWFGDELGDYVGPTSRGRITRSSPGWLVKIFGWVFLLALIGYPLYEAIRLSGVIG